MDLQTPQPTSTVRRNPPRKARQTLFTTAPLTSASASTGGGITPFPSLDELLPPDPPPSAPKSSSDPLAAARNLKVFLRIRPLEVRPRPGRPPPRPRGKAPPPPSKKGRKGKTGVALVVNDSSSVTLSGAPSVLDQKRTKSEVYDGFSFVFPPESGQEEIYERVMDPLVMEFMGGKSALLAAMGPTGSGKTHTMFGSAREPGMVPLALRQIINHSTESKNPHSLRSYYLSMFEIHSERGKGERIFDLSPDGVDLSLQQSTIKGLQEVKISNAAEAESLLALGMLKRTTAATNANNESSRSQCIINIRSAPKDIEENDFPPYSAVLTIADLAGAEREKKTGNQGSRLLESNFINNTSMVFGLCLRSLLEHQKYPKKPLEKHFKNSLLTRYLRDYLEGKKCMTLILTVKPGEDDYLDTSYLLRQASPYMQIKYNNLEEFPHRLCQKRGNTSFARVENHKRQKFNDSKASLVSAGKSERDVIDGCPLSDKECYSEKLQEVETDKPSKNSPKSLQVVDIVYEEHHVEMESLKRNEEVMSNFSKALWNVLKQYKHRLEDSEYEVQTLIGALRKEISQVVKLKKELAELKSCCSCHKHPALGKCSSPVAGTPFIHSSAGVPSTDQDTMKHFDNTPEDNCVHLPTCQTIENFSATISDPEVLGLKGILTDTNLKGDCKIASPSSLERRTLIVERNKCMEQKNKSSLQKNDQGNDDLVALDDFRVSETTSASDSTVSVHPDHLVTSVQSCIMVEDDTSILQKSNDCSTLPKEEYIEQKSKSSLKNDHVNGDLREMEDFKVGDMTSNACSADMLVNSIQSYVRVEESTSILPSSSDHSILLKEEVETAGTMFLRSTVEDINRQNPQNGQLLDQKSRSFLEFECNSADLEVAKDAHMEFSCSASVAGVDDKGMLPLSERVSCTEEREHLESQVPHLEADQENDKSQVNKPLKNEKLGSSSKPLKEGKLKRRLLPVSAMLLKEFSGLDIDAENAKEGRGKVSAAGRGRSQGSISLVRLLKSNLHQ